MIAEIHRSKGEVPPTRENFVARLAAAGFDNAIAVYDQFAAAPGSAFKLDANEIYGWGAQLYHLNKVAESREIFRLGTHLYPAMSFLHDGLAEMQAKTGQTQDALKSYRRVLELDPKNADAAKYLKEHGAEQGVSAL
jgi:tetratricopeptide (TPR) repeat protein